MKHRMTRTRRVGRLEPLARTTAIAVSLALLPLVALPRSPEAGASSEVVVTIDRVIGTGTDDAEQRMGERSVALTSSDLELSTDGTTVQTVGLRFTDITVPSGAAITRAWVQFRVDEASNRAASLTIAGQAADYPRTFADGQGNISSRARTTATVRWIPPSWPKVGAAGPDQRTPDLSPVIGEIVGRPGWVPGHALALIITGTGRRTAEAFDGAAPRSCTSNTAPAPRNRRNRRRTTSRRGCPAAMCRRRPTTGSRAVRVRAAPSSDRSPQGPTGALPGG